MYDDEDEYEIEAVIAEDLPLAEDFPALPEENPFIPTRMLTHDARIMGMQVPANNDYFKCNDYERRCWRSAVEEAMARGIMEHADLGRLFSLSKQAVIFIRKQVLNSWTSGLTPETINLRREQLYREVDRVKHNAWAYFEAGKQNGADVKEQGALLKLVLDASSAQVKMCGLNSVNVQLEHTVAAKFKTSSDFEQEAAKLLGVDVTTLASLGNLIASKIGETENED